MKKWYSKYLQVYEKPFSYAPAAVVEEVRGKLAGLQSEQPLVTVSLIGYNEERHLLACLWSLSEMQCRYPVEIIGVDNESKDRTAEIYRATGVPYYTETRHSCGFARLCGLNHARGKYHINIDSDTLYPHGYHPWRRRLIGTGIEKVWKDRFRTQTPGTRSDGIWHGGH